VKSLVLGFGSSDRCGQCTFVEKLILPMVRFCFLVSRSHSALVFIFFAFGLYSCSVLQKPVPPLEATETGIKRGTDSLKFQLNVWKNMMPGPSSDRRSLHLSMDVISKGLQLAPLSLDSVRLVYSRYPNVTWRIPLSTPPTKKNSTWTYWAYGREMDWRGNDSVRADIFGRYGDEPFIYDGWSGRIQVVH